ncbi:flagellar hook-associated protein FlgL [Thermosediminibacter oceani]|uniref:Flagellar hook-associated protein 3 n=1 Tax=Thermosediminibacter oceani (strain ATCC BAA-1034 / DSM 16646 / JW/IW-1228P) TaxID=555079 RepID=D9RYB2_THEOJ|nr:flagellar hook-associated protein FlgL [Thermosediminibacter oceani]ADL08336.1 flagellar hook-associated protein 3 [Thermosediminibacter oceani DSM 16646]
MRVTQSMITEAFIRNLSQNLRRLGKKEDMLASGKKVRLPSDDPVSATLAMRLRDTLLTVEQYTKNTEDAITWLKSTETALANTGEILQRIRELTVYAANDTLSAEEREMVLDEITQLKHQLLQEANASHNKKYLFNGYHTDQAPFYIDAMDGKIKPSVATSETVDYNIGRSNSIQVNVMGNDVFTDIFLTVEDIEQDLLNNDSASLSGRLDQLDNAIDTVLKYRSQIGARINRLEATKTRLEYNNIDYTELLSKTEDVDVAKLIMDLKMEENVYRASLAVGARIIQPTLVDFLR